MTTNTLTVSSTMDSLIGAYRSHVLGRTLPPPVTVSFNPYVGQISVQPEGGLNTARQLGNVLIWAYTLAEVTAQWWHTPDGGLHVTVTGRIGGGARLKVYGGGPFAECQGLVPLEPDQREGVSLDELYALVGLLRETQEQREVA